MKETSPRNQGDDDDGYLLFADLIQCKYSQKSSAQWTEGFAIWNLISLRLAQNEKS